MHIAGGGVPDEMGWGCREMQNRTNCSGIIIGLLHTSQMETIKIIFLRYRGGCFYLQRAALSEEVQRAATDISVSNHFRPRKERERC